MAVTTFDLDDLKRRMQGATQSLKHELGGLRTGRAAASMLEPVQVEAYGSHMPLNQVATISVPEPRLLSVQVWDKTMVKAVEKAIVDSNLGLSPATEGQVLRLRIPELNEERRKELVKLDALPVDQIDTSDIPELSDEQWADAVRGRFYRPIKQQITARVDADVLAWLKAGGQGYQTRMNAILRRAMMAELDRRA